MAFEFSLEEVLFLVGLWFGTSMVANLLWTRFVLMKYTGRALIAWIEDLGDDEKGREAIGTLLYHMMNWMFSAQIKTGEKIKIKVETGKTDAEGKPVEETREEEEILPPVAILGRQMGNYVLAKMKGSAGGLKNQLGAMLDAQAIMGDGEGLSPASLKAIQKGNLGPALAEIAARHLSKKMANTAQVASEWK